MRKRFTPSFLRKTGRILMIVFAFILTAALVAGAMLEANAGQVNNYLGTTTTKITGGGDYDSFEPDYDSASELVQAHIDMGTRLAEEGTVLLKNNDNSALPLEGDEKITLLGLAGTEDGAIYSMITGSLVESSQNVSLYDALTTVGFDINDTVYNVYNSHGTAASELVATTELDISDVESEAGSAAFNSSISEYSDAALIVLGRPTEEGEDYSYTSHATSPLALTQSEKDLITWATSGSRFDKVIVLVTTSNAMELGEIESNDGVDAILLAGPVGNYGFYGIANILAGEANPSGRLVDIYSSDAASSPAMMNFGDYSYSNSSALGVVSSDYGSSYVVYAEGIYTGYKYYETRYEDVVLNQGNARSSTGQGYFKTSSTWTYSEEVTYAFGYGLSYTTFTQEITNVNFSDDGTTATVYVTVTNTGSVAGKSVVQVYGQSPYTQYDKNNGIEKASVQLLAYEKTEEIEAHDSTTVEVEVDMQYLATYDSENAGTYIMEQDDNYYFALGWNTEEEGSHAAINNILAAKGYTPSNTDGYMDGTGSTTAAYQFEWKWDEDTFSVSKAGVEITNQLDDIDYNYYQEDGVTYLSRSDWSGTWPKTYSGLAATNDMTGYLTNTAHTNATASEADTENLPEFGQDGEYQFTDMFGSEFDDERWDDVINQISLTSAVYFTATGNRTFYEISEIHFLSSSSYTENGSYGLAKTLTQQADEYAPWSVSSSDEYASYSTNTYGAPSLQAATWNKELIEEMGVLWGNDSLFVNMPMVWAPNVNTHRTPFNGRNGDYFSEDPILSGTMALSMSDGAISKGLIMSVKHFAFNDQETNRTGVSTYMTEQAAREGELRGFQIAFEGHYDSDGNRTVSMLGTMTGFNRIGPVYVSSHTGLMQNILRGEWDFNGYATTDFLMVNTTYMSYEETMLAGTTNFDASSTGSTSWLEDDHSTNRTISSIVSDIQYDAEVLSALKENLHYALYAFSQSNLANWMTSTTQTVWAWNWWRVTYYTMVIVGGVLIAGGAVLYVLSYVGPLSDNWKKKKEVKGDEG